MVLKLNPSQEATPLCVFSQTPPSLREVKARLAEISPHKASLSQEGSSSSWDN